jgi:hypothetical protein
MGSVLCDLDNDLSMSPRASCAEIHLKIGPSGGDYS